MLPGPTVAERFEIERRVGEGGMAIVYRARDRLTGQPVAVKVHHTRTGEDVERFGREARLLAELTHPGIVRYVSHGTMPGGAHYLAMEWIDGPTLAERIAFGELTVRESILLARRVADALAEAHRKGVVHRDIKPTNLLLPNGQVERVKVADFGVARRARALRGITQSGMRVGTPGYMAPEQARGVTDVDARADVFSLGCVLYECLSGRPAFTAENTVAVQAKILWEEPPRLMETLAAKVPTEIAALVRWMLQKERQERPADAGVIAAALSAVLEGGQRLTPDDDRSPKDALQQEAATSSYPVRRARSTGITRTAGLGSSEQRVVSVLLVQGAWEQGDDQKEAEIQQALRSIVDPQGAKLERLAVGVLVAAMGSAGTARDQAVQAGRCALKLLESVPGARVVVATGPAVVSGPLPTGAVIDRGARLLRQATPDAIRLDEVTAGLLDARFHVEGDATGLILRGEHEAMETARTLLGRVTPFVGRDRELSMLEGVLEECISEPVARAVLVTGASGTGKSRLLHEFLRRIALKEDRRIEILSARGESVSAGSPFGMLAFAIRRSAGIREGEPRDVRRRKLRARLGRHLRGGVLLRVSDFIGEMVGIPTAPEDASDALRAARHDLRVMHDVMLTVWEDWLRAECASQPLLLVLEDLHWGDGPTIKFIDASLRTLRDSPFMVLALARPEVHEQFPGIWTERDVQEIRLAPLGKRASRQLARETLGDGANDETVERVVELAEGNAFYLEELVRAVAEGAPGALPSSIVAMVQVRLSGLGADAKRILRAASIFGQTFWRGGVAALLGETAEINVDEWLADLAEREVIHRRGTGAFPNETEYAFRHEFLREAAYAMLTEEDRRLGHRIAAQWLEQIGERDAIVLAEHHERGGEPAHAMPWYVGAAEQAIDANDPAGAIERANRGLACGAEGQDRGLLLVLKARAHHTRGESSDASTCALAALEELTRGSAGWFQAAAQYHISVMGEDWASKVAEWAHRSAHTPPLEGAEPAQLRCLSQAAFRLFQAGRYAEGEPFLRQADRLFQMIGRSDPLAALNSHRARATRALHLGDITTYLDEHHAALALMGRAGDVRGYCNLLVNIGFAYGELGLYAQSEQESRRSLVEAERLSYRLAAAWARRNLGRALALQGNVDEGGAYVREALEIAERARNARLQGTCQKYLSLFARIRRDPQSAEGQARLAIDTLRASPPARVEAFALLAGALLDLGRAAEARAAASQAMAEIEQVQGIEGSGSLVRLTFAEALEATGDIVAARAALAVARDTLLSQAAQIRDASWRTTFMTCVPENARILALAEERGLGRE